MIQKIFNLSGKQWQCKRTMLILCTVGDLPMLSKIGGISNNSKCPMFNYIGKMCITFNGHC